MKYYYEAQIKQLIIPNGDWEVIYGEKGEDSIDDVVYFALCDLIAKPCINEELDGSEDCYGVILPVVLTEEEGLTLEITTFYKDPNEQKVEVRRIQKEVKDGRTSIS